MEKKRILLTIPSALLEDADLAAYELRLTRGEFIRHAIIRGVSDFKESRRLQMQTNDVRQTDDRPKKWTVFNG